MKKAFDWFESSHLKYEFHDYKKSGVDQHILKEAINKHGWDNVINRKGMTWRQLPDAIKNSMDEKAAIQIALEKPSIIKRPLIKHDDGIELGFDDSVYSKLFI